MLSYKHTQTNTCTFQVVLAADRESSFMLFVYEDGGIQWTTGNADGGTSAW